MGVLAGGSACHDCQHVMRCMASEWAVMLAQRRACVQVQHSSLEEQGMPPTAAPRLVVQDLYGATADA